MACGIQTISPEVPANHNFTLFVVEKNNSYTGKKGVEAELFHSVAKFAINATNLLTSNGIYNIVCVCVSIYMYVC